MKPRSILAELLALATILRKAGYSVIVEDVLVCCFLATAFEYCARTLSQSAHRIGEALIRKCHVIICGAAVRIITVLAEVLRRRASPNFSRKLVLPSKRAMKVIRVVGIVGGGLFGLQHLGLSIVLGQLVVTHLHSVPLTVNLEALVLCLGSGTVGVAWFRDARRYWLRD